MPYQVRTLWRREAVATLLLSWPLIFSQVAQIALGMTDMILLGHLGPDVIAAGALAINLYHALLLFGIGVMSATMPMVARERGRMRHSVRDVRRTFRQSLWVAVTLSVPMWAVLWHAEAIFRLFGQDPVLSREAARMLAVLMWALFPSFVIVGLRSFFAAMERPMWPLAVSLITVPVNALAGWLLIYGRFGAPQLGIVGAGWATFLSSLFTVAVMVLILGRDRRLKRYHLFGRFWRPDWGRWRTFMRLGIPIGLTVAFEVTVFNAAAFLVGLFGAIPLAAHAVTLQLASFTFMFPLGLSQAVTVRVGLAYGQNDAPGVVRAGWTAFGLTLAIMSGTAAMMALFPDLLIGVFLNPAAANGPETFELARTFLKVAAIFQLVDGLQAVASGALRGRHDTRIPMIIAGLGYWGIGFGTSVLLAFSLGMGALGVWIGLAIGLLVVSIMLMWRWIWLTREAEPATAPA